MAMYKFTNRRQGDFNLHAIGVTLPPGVSFHDASIFERMPDGMKDSLELHVKAGELEIAPARVVDDKPAPQVPRALPPVLAGLPVNAPALSQDTAEALKQIAAETSPAVLDAWFNGVPAPSVEITHAILERNTAISPV